MSTNWSWPSKLTARCGCIKEAVVVCGMCYGAKRKFFAYVKGLIKFHWILLWMAPTNSWWALDGCW